ncbi:MAG: NAD(P)-dependent oxidoreductase [Lachnospiraceae bacterium]|nr:NAD(P)-dependent oxidoreductase [Lachnospiraceae bacterium]
MRTIVMTGATSFLGRNVLKKLLKQGYEVYALVRPQSGTLSQLPEDSKLHLLYGSMENIVGIKDKVSEADSFLHFAWDGSGNQGRANHEIQMKNVDYSLEALALAYSLHCKKFIFSGSQAEYGNKKEKITEKMNCNPISEYGKAKLEFSLAAEKYCENKDIRFIHLRIFSVYGYGDRENTLVDACVKKFNSGELMKLGPCVQKWNYLNIKDFANIVLHFLESDISGGIYNVASEDTRVLRDFVKEIYDLSNKSGIYEFGKEADNPEGSPELDVDVQKMKNAIGYKEEINFKQGILEIMQQMNKEG